MPPHASAPSDSPPSRTLSALLWTGTIARVLFFVLFIGLFFLVKANPEADTMWLGGLMLTCIGVALSPGMGVPMLWTGKMRVRAGLLTALTGVAGGSAVNAEPDLGIRIFGGLLTAIGAVVVLLGGGLFWSGVMRALDAA